MIEAPVKGKVAFYRPNGKLVRTVDVGAPPDMLTFSPNGLLVVVANEGEPDGAIDPQRCVSIIGLRRGAAHATARTADFTAFDGQPLDPSIVIAVGNPSVDLEPDYRFLCHNYEPGDRLYLFGFSRGAYTARSLAGLVRNSGILIAR